MAVSEIIALPAQPTLGNTFQIPLGGDGWSAPSSVYELAISLPGDVSGGNNALQVDFDPRYQGIVTYVEIRRNAAAGPLEGTISLIPFPRSTPQLECFVNAMPVNSLNGTNLMSWCPPPVPGITRLNCAVPNTDATTLTLFAWIYMFKIQVFEKVPLNIILASLPRAESQFPTTAG